MNQPSSPPPPQHEPGGNRLMIAVALIVVTALVGMTWSFISRQNAPRGVQISKPFHVPPSAKPTDAKPATGTLVPAPPTPAQR